MAEVILQDVWKKYGKVEALKGLSLKVGDGEFFVLLGPSGAGKTTTLKVIAGVEPVTAGRIFINGQLVNALEPQERNIAMAFESYALYPHYSVYENLSFPLRAPGMKLSEQEIRQRVQEVAELLNIHMLLDRRPVELSGGQKQRASLGRTMIRQPDVFLLDEPLSHLDAKLRHRMRAEFKRLELVLQTTTIYVTHDYQEALSLGDQIAVINLGEIQQVGSREEVFNRPVNEFVAIALGQPEINLIDCRVVSENGQMKFRSSDGQITLSAPPAIRARLNQLDLDMVRIGLRPIYISLADGSQTGDRLKGHVYVFEHVGTKGILSVKVGEKIIDVVTPVDLNFEMDQEVILTADSSKIMIFGPHTGRNLMLEEA